MQTFFATLSSALLFTFAFAGNPPPDAESKQIEPCSDQSCTQSRPIVASNNAGYPNCLVYNSADSFDDTFKAKSGHGYDVWWNSADPGDTCQYIVRSPATADSSDCGLFLTSWDSAGCWYTNIVESFNLQFCCGTGDCGKAAPALNARDAREQAAAGNTTIVSLALDMSAFREEESGKQRIEDFGEISWKPSANTQSARSHPRELSKKQSDPNPLPQDGCSFAPNADSRYTQAGRQVRASPTNTCDQSSCRIDASTALAEGYTVSPSVSANVAGVLTAALGVQFTYTTTYTATNSYTQTGGTTGYVSFTPTFDCWVGRFTNCKVNTGQNIFTIPEDQDFTACTPALYQNGGAQEPSGQFLFVYEN